MLNQVLLPQHSVANHKYHFSDGEAQRSVAQINDSTVPPDEPVDEQGLQPSIAFLKFAIACMLVGSAIYGMALFVFAPEQTGRALAVLLLVLLAGTAGFLLSRGRVRATVLALGLGGWAFITCTSFFFGGVGGSLIIIYPLTILLIGWLIDTRTAALVTFLTLVVTLCFVLCDWWGILPVPPPTPPALRWVVQCFVFILSAAMIARIVDFYRSRLEEVRKLDRDLAQRTAELQAREVDLNRAQAVANVGSWIYDLVSDKMVLSAETCRIFGMPEVTIGNHISYRAHVHPADRKSLDRAWAFALKGAGPFDSEHRIRVGKELRWVRQRAEFERDADGKPFRCVGITQDITERIRKSALMELLESLARATNEAITPEVAMRSCLERICIYGNWPLGHVVLFASGQSAGVVATQIWCGSGMRRFEPLIQISAGYSYNPSGGQFAAEAIRERRPVWIEDFSKWRGDSKNRIETIKGFGIRAGFVFPVFVGDAIAGFLEFFDTEVHAPDEMLLDAINSVASQLARLIERSRAAAKLAQIATIVENTNDAIVGRDRHGTIIVWNAAAERLLGWTAAEAIGRNLTQMFPPEELARIAANRKQVAQGGTVTHEAVRLAKDGRPIEVSLGVSPIMDDRGNIIGSATIFRDLTERKQTEERIRHLASYDELTGLPNRNMFHERLRHALARAQRHSRRLAVLFIDLDRFKNINDTLGHEAGDQVLKEVAQRLRGCLRDSDNVGRLGGDEFVVLIEELPQFPNAAAVAQKILDAVARPFIVAAREFHLGASIGISGFPADGKDLPSLLKNADMAMYRAKELGKHNYQYYSAQMNIGALERLEMESDLRHALERNEFVLHYQPKINIVSGRITSVEALLRWQHPVKGLVQPTQFIQLAEETGLIAPIGEWVLKTACAQNKSWQAQGLPPLRIAVNLSARQFSHENLLQGVARVLDETALDPAALEFEITESMVMKDPERAVTLLNKLKAMGIHLSIDDFGTGYSSLSYLKRFPIDSLKIDRSFIRDLPADADDAAITRAILAMAHSLKLNVIAEGVETEEQLRFLRDHECDEMQGYYFSKPVPEHEFARLVRSQIACRELTGAFPR